MPIITLENGDQLQFWDKAEDIGGPIYQFANDGSRVERPVQVLYNQINLARLAFLGYPFIVEEEGVRYISRQVPHVYEDLYDLSLNPYMYATAIQRGDGIRVADTSPITGGPAGVLAQLRVVYNALTYKVRTDAEMAVLFPFIPEGESQDNPLSDINRPDEASLARYVTRRYKPFQRVITVPRALPWFVLEAGDAEISAATATTPARGPVVMEGIGKPETGIVLEYIHHLRPDIPWNAIEQAMGKINEFTFDGFEPETLLCEPPEIIPVISPLGEIIHDIIFRFRYLPKVALDGVAKGHNWFLHNVKRTAAPLHVLDYRLVTTTGDATGTTVFQKFDFSKLFRPDQE